MKSVIENPGMSFIPTNWKSASDGKNPNPKEEINDDDGEELPRLITSSSSISRKLSSYSAFGLPILSNSGGLRLRLGLKKIEKVIRSELNRSLV